MSRQENETLLIDGRRIPLRVRHDRRARRMVLRLDPAGETVRLTLPAGVSVGEGVRFAEDRAPWLGARLAALPPRVAFDDGAVVPILGVDHEVRHRPRARRGVWREGRVIHVSGAVEHVARRLRDWLKEEARREIEPRVRNMAAAIDRGVGRVSVREARARWGSCSSAGNLSFCWRLILAPEPVLDYVVAHEVAHLAELNHGPRFWRLVATLVADTKAPRAWLRRHGPRLHRYG